MNHDKPRQFSLEHQNYYRLYPRLEGFRGFGAAEQAYQEAMKYFMSSPASEEDFQAADKLFRAAADQCHAPAANEVAKRLHLVKGNLGEAMRWYVKAADFGHISAQMLVAEWILNGTGVPKNRAEAIFWFNVAAQRGQPMAEQQVRTLTGEGSQSVPWSNPNE